MGLSYLLLETVTGTANIGIKALDFPLWQTFMNFISQFSCDVLHPVHNWKERMQKKLWPIMRFRKWNLYCIICRLSTLIHQCISISNDIHWCVNSDVNWCDKYVFKGIRWCLRRPVAASLPSRTVMMDQSVGAKLCLRNAIFLCENFWPSCTNLTYIITVMMIILSWN